MTLLEPDATLHARLFRDLCACGEHLSPAARKAVLAEGDAALPVLCALLGDDTLHAPDAPGQGYVPLHAVELLGEIGAASAVPALLDALATADPLDYIWTDVINAVERIGPGALDAVLERLAVTPAAMVRSGLCEILGKVGRGSPAARDAVLAMLDFDPMIAAMALARLGDPAVVPALQAKMLSIELQDSARLMPNQEMFELEAALLKLGGEIPPEARAKLDLVGVQREAQRQQLLRVLAPALAPESVRSALPRIAQPLERRPAKIGRNDPCFCGSGKKHKKCCGG